MSTNASQPRGAARGRRIPTPDRSASPLPSLSPESQRLQSEWLASPRATRSQHNKPGNAERGGLASGPPQPGTSAVPVASGSRDVQQVAGGLALPTKRGPGLKSQTWPSRRDRSSTISTVLDGNISDEMTDSDEERAMERYLDERRAWRRLHSGQVLTRSSKTLLRARGEELPLVSLASGSEAESASSAAESESGSDVLRESDSSMDWEEDDPPVEEHEAAEGEESEDDVEIIPAGSPFLDPAVRTINDKISSLTRQVTRLEKSKKAGDAFKKRARRLDKHLHAERYTSTHYRQLLRITQAELSEFKKQKEELAAKLAEAQAGKASAEQTTGRLESNLRRSEAMVKNIDEILKQRLNGWRVEKEGLTRRLTSAAREKEEADVLAASARDDANRQYAVLRAEKEAVEREKGESDEGKRTAEAKLGEAERKLGIIRNAHDFERESYLKRIQALEEQLRVKVEGDGSG